jgi:hypothetical protein
VGIDYFYDLDWVAQTLIKGKCHLKGDKITHRWSYKGKVKAEIDFDIKGNRWRVWSSKNLWHRWTGQWKVEVINQHNQILLTKTFEYKKEDE